MDLLEQLIQHYPTNIHNWRWISFYVLSYISRFPSNQASNANAIWDPAILESLKNKNPPLHLTQLFSLVTTAINDLRGVEYALCNYEENVSALIGAGILIQVLRHFERLLSQWTICHSLEYMDSGLLSTDHLLFPKILRKPVVGPTTQPGGKHIFTHPTHSFFALLLCLVTSAWSLHPLRMAIMFSFSSKRSRYSFQVRSPFWTILEEIPLLLPWPIAHWILSKCSIPQMVLLTVVTVSFAILTTKVKRSGLVPACMKQTIINFLIDRSVYESYFIVYLCCTDRSLATQLNMVLIYFFLQDLLVSTIDPTGLSRARVYYCGDISITLQNGDVNSLIKIKSGFYP
jgi:hypothetical protein